jgi:hypothetical protein
VGGIIIRVRDLRVLDYAVAPEAAGVRVRLRQVTQQGDTVMTVAMSRTPPARPAGYLVIERGEADGWFFQSGRWIDNWLVVFAGKTAASIRDGVLEPWRPVDNP